MCSEASIMQFNSSDPVFNFAEYTRDFVPKDSNLKDVGQVTSLAKQLDPAIQSTDSWKCWLKNAVTRLPKWGVHHLSAQWGAS